MGGFMSPAMAILLCAMIELGLFADSPQDIIGTILRYMDDVFAIFAVSTQAEEEEVRKYLARVAKGYPEPLVLNVEPESDTVRFLDLLVSTNGPDLQVQLFNNNNLLHIANASTSAKIQFYRACPVTRTSIFTFKTILTTYPPTGKSLALTHHQDAEDMVQSFPPSAAPPAKVA